MLLYKKEMSYNDPLNVVFLCGSKFDKTSKKEKRTILKEYLSQSAVNCQSIILEENFVFSKQRRNYLAYDNIFLKNLSEVEKLASLYADKIIIIHETISTAAEIGMLAGETPLLPKICILVPDDISIEENKLSMFIKLAFLNNEDKAGCKPKIIVYYPDVKIYRSSANKSEYHTYFHENKIGDELGKQILSFVAKKDPICNIVFKKLTFDKPISSQNILSYKIDAKNKRVAAYVYANTLKLQLLAMFAVDEFKTEFRSEKFIKDHVTYIEVNYKKILLDTICNIEGLNSSEYSVCVELSDTKVCGIRQAIGYFLYMLQAIEFIKLEQVNVNKDSNIRKIRITEKMESYIVGIRAYLYEKTKTAFGGIIS